MSRKRRGRHGRGPKRRAPQAGAHDRVEQYLQWMSLLGSFGGHIELTAIQHLNEDRRLVVWEFIMAPSQTPRAGVVYPADELHCVYGCPETRARCLLRYYLAEWKPALQPDRADGHRHVRPLRPGP